MLHEGHRLSKLSDFRHMHVRGVLWHLPQAHQLSITDLVIAVGLVPSPVFSVQKPIRTVPLPVKPQKPPKLQRCFIKHTNQKFEDSVNLYGVLTVEVGLYQTYIGTQFWDCLKDGADGGKKKVTKFEWPCLATQLFYAVLLPVLSSPGQSILIDRRKKGTVVRTVEESSLQTLERFLAFQKRHKEAGLDNCRVVKRKGVTFYNIATHFKATHTEKEDGDVQYAKFEITVCSVNPEAVVTLHSSIEQSESNISTLQRYCRSYPIRAKKAGISTEPGLIKICRAHARINLQSQPTTGALQSSNNSSQVASTSTGDTNITNALTVTTKESTVGTKRKRSSEATSTTISTINPEELP